jgi:hypothetical protein
MTKITYKVLPEYRQVCQVYADGNPTPYTVHKGADFYTISWNQEMMAAGYSAPCTPEGKARLHEKLQEIALKPCVKAKYQKYYIVEGRGGR